MTNTEAVTAAILASSKYRALHPDLVRWVVAREAAKGRPANEVEKAARAKLHQVVTAYLPERPAVERWLAELAAAPPELEAQRAVCRRLLAFHASSRERLPLLDSFYGPLFAGVAGPIGGDGLPTAPVVLDLACGMNPLALPWMGLPAGARLIACDVQTDLTGLLARALPLLESTTGVQGEAFAWNLLAGAPPVRADVALLLKTLPCLEQLDVTLPERLLASVNAPLLIVSFPVRSLGGRSKGMAATYQAHFETLVARLGWSATVVRRDGELVFRLHKPLPTVPVNDPL
ncbi:MAG: 16S rRNA methyltransferase [Caldilineaceae bacterium]